MKRLFIFVLFVIPLFCSANELQMRKYMDGKVQELFLQNKFSDLENMAKEYRENESRTSSGLWMLTLFYGAIENIQSYDNKNVDVWNALLTKADIWIKEYPASPTPYIAKNSILKRQAWIIRGVGYSNTVKPKSWSPFFEKVKLEKEVLNDSKHISSLDPHWFTDMAEIATLESWDEQSFNKLTEEGLNKFPYYSQLYFNIMGYYTPKWHGNAQKIEAFARDALSKTKDKEGYGMYARIYWAASQSQFQGKLFQDSKVEWKIMSMGIDDVLKKYPDQWNINNFAFFSCIAKDKIKAHRLISMITEPPILSGWLDDIEYYNYCKKWSAN